MAEFQRRFRWKYGQLERGREFPRVPRVSKKISLKVWPTWTGSGVFTSSTSFKEDFVESMANLNGVGSFHEFHEFQRRFRWKYGQRLNGIHEFHEFLKISLKVWPSERGREFPRVPRVSKKISLKVWPTWTIDHQPLFESKERLRSSEIKEDGLRFVLRVSEELYLNIYWILNIIWMYIYIYIYIFF